MLVWRWPWHSSLRLLSARRFFAGDRSIALTEWGIVFAELHKFFRTGSRKQNTWLAPTFISYSLLESQSVVSGTREGYDVPTDRALDPVSGRLAGNLDGRTAASDQCGHTGKRCARSAV